MSCENNENHDKDRYCKSCATCHDCNDEYQTDLEDKIKRLEREIINLKKSTNSVMSVGEYATIATF